MHVVIAPDKFAGTLTARESADAMATGWRRGDPGAVLDSAPLSDGGPGFVSVLHAALGGDLIPAEVSGPLGSRVPATLLVHEADGCRSAYVESAQACGLALVDPTPRTAWASTTRGVGELLAAALDQRVDRVVVGVGGTASTDGGRGCLDVLVGHWPEGVELLVASDVTAPLLGPGGAAHVFGPQKGADSDTVDRLEERLSRWATDSGGRADGLDQVAGSGAGGGLGFGLLLLGGRVVPGAGTVVEAVDLRRRLAGSDVVVTGEGRIDESSLLGKVVLVVATLALDVGVPCVVLAGDRAVAATELGGSGIDEVRSLVETYGREAALAAPAQRLADLAEGLARDVTSAGAVLPPRGPAGGSVSPWNTGAEPMVDPFEMRPGGATRPDHDRRSRP